MSLHRSRTGPFIAETASSIALPSAGPAISRRGLFTACACCAAGLFAAPRGALAIAPGASRSSHSQPSTWNGGSSYLDVGATGLAALAATVGAVSPLHARLDASAQAIEQRKIGWRRDIHKNPELVNQ